MLCFDPKQRITAAEALAHPLLAAYHDPDDEVRALAEPACLLVEKGAATLTRPLWCTSVAQMAAQPDAPETFDWAFNEKDYSVETWRGTF